MHLFNEIVEGANTKIKFLNRQTCGKASFALYYARLFSSTMACVIARLTAERFPALPEVNTHPRHLHPRGIAGQG
jgi:hypothetical protein